MCRPHWRAVPTPLAWALRTAWTAVKHTRQLQRAGRASRVDVLNAIAEYGSARRKALEAAQRGDFRRLDALELAAINARVRLGEYAIVYPDGRLHPWFDPDAAAFERIGSDNEATAFAIVRGAAPGGRMLIAWSVLPYCPRCYGRRSKCRACGGLGYHAVDVHADVVMDIVDVLTTSDGIVVEDRVEAE